MTVGAIGVELPLDVAVLASSRFSPRPNPRPSASAKQKIHAALSSRIAIFVHLDGRCDGFDKGFVGKTMSDAGVDI